MPLRKSGLSGVLLSEVVDVSVVIVGGGPAGLSVSRELSELGLEHVVLEASQVASAWRARWDFHSGQPRLDAQSPWQPVRR